jgi:D-serine deaminase-like pyridoxal phosphate-dependent protein
MLYDPVISVLVVPVVYLRHDRLKANVDDFKDLAGFHELKRQPLHCTGPILLGKTHN